MDECRDVNPKLLETTDVAADLVDRGGRVGVSGDGDGEGLAPDVERMAANRMFKLIADSPIIVKEEKCLQISTIDQSKLWHHRYGHLSYKGLRTL